MIHDAEVATMQSDMSEEVIGTPDLDEARVVYEKLVDGTVTVEDVCESDVLNRIKDRLHKHAALLCLLRCPPELDHSGFSTWVW